VRFEVQLVSSVVRNVDAKQTEESDLNLFMGRVESHHFWHYLYQSLETLVYV